MVQVQTLMLVFMKLWQATDFYFKDGKGFTMLLAQSSARLSIESKKEKTMEKNKYGFVKGIILRCVNIFNLLKLHPYSDISNRYVRLSLLKTSVIIGIFYIGVFTSCVPQEITPTRESNIIELTQITTGQNSLYSQPAITPDGKYIIFVSDRSNPNARELWMEPLNGGGIQELTNSSDWIWDLRPAVSPNEREVVFESNRVENRFNIWKLSFGTRGLTQLTNCQYGCYTPSYSPDGKKIVYVANDSNGDSYIWVMDDDGGNTIELGPGFQPRFTVNNKIVYVKTIPGNKNGISMSQIWIMNADGTDQTEIVRDPNMPLYTPSVSPDGRKVIFVKLEKGYSQYINKRASSEQVFIYEKSEIWLKDLTQRGRSETQLTEFNGVNAYPIWTPDGKKIIFISNRSGNWNIWSFVPKGY